MRDSERGPAAEPTIISEKTPMAKFDEGDPVWYVPDHADGPDHKDAEAGIVVEVGLPPKPGYDRGYWVDYDDNAPIAKMTYERHLEKREVDDDE